MFIFTIKKENSCRHLALNVARFFLFGNINVLREFSLRFRAYRVDKELNEYMQERDIVGPCLAEISIRNGKIRGWFSIPCG